MAISLFKKNTPIQLFSAEEQAAIVSAIQSAEQKTSGEIRVFIENKCRFVDPLDRALEIFGELQMERTALRNAVLIYIAVQHKQLAIFGDQGIHQQLGQEFWEKEVEKMILSFNKENYTTGIISIIDDIGKALCEKFPFDATTDKNELPDDIVFGK